MLERFIDVRDALRSIRARRLHALGIVLTTALAVGATTAIMTLVHGVLMRPLPFRNPEALVWIWGTTPEMARGFFSIPNFLDARARTAPLFTMAGVANWTANLTGAGDPERLQGVRIAPEAFGMLGNRAVLGRLLEADDGRLERPKVVVLGHGLWRRRFAGAPDVIGSSLTLNGEPFEIVGVLAPDFALTGGMETNVVTALRLEDDPQRDNRGSNFLRVIARLQGTTTVDRAREAMAVVFRDLRTMYPEDDGGLTAPRVIPLREEVVGDYRKTLPLLLGAVAVMLLIACANLANLTLAALVTRRQDFATRAALGATPARISRAIVVESLLLTSLGGLAGAVLALGGRTLLLRFVPPDMPRLGELHFDPMVLAAAIGVTLLTGVIVALAPAADVFGATLKASLSESGRWGSEGPGTKRVRQGLVVAQVALSVALLVAAALFVRSLDRLEAVRVGVDIDRVAVVRVSLPTARYKDLGAMLSFYDRAVGRIVETPGVEAVALTNAPPLSGINARSEFIIPGRTQGPDEHTASQIRWTGAGWFRTLGIPVVRGREFVATDDSSGRNVAVVDEAWVRKFLAGGEAIGRHVLLDMDSDAPKTDFEIVGIAGNVRHENLTEDPAPTLYMPYRQIVPVALGGVTRSAWVAVRSKLPAATIGDVTRRALRSVDADIPAAPARGLGELLAGTLAARRFQMRLYIALGVAALILASLGLYSVLSYVTARRTREMAIRLAVGGSRGAVVGLVVSDGMRLALLGIALGSVLAVLSTRWIESSLYGVSPLSPAVYIVVAVLLAAVSAIACSIPARRASRVDPAVALRAP